MNTQVPATLLDGRTVIVTGAARGVGKGIAAALVERGASVLIVDRDADPLTATADQFREAGLPVTALVADLRDPGCAQDIVTAA
ncbi:NAD(P)-dependent oxidoreductase, partial [Mycobacterium sp. ITM-2017-0098]